MIENLSVRDFHKMLVANGYSKVRQRGSHQIWTNGVKTISVPSVTLKPVIAQRLIKENNLR